MGRVKRCSTFSLMHAQSAQQRLFTKVNPNAFHIGVVRSPCLTWSPFRTACASCSSIEFRLSNRICKASVTSCCSKSLKTPLLHSPRLWAMAGEKRLGSMWIHYLLTCAPTRHKGQFKPRWLSPQIARCCSNHPRSASMRASTFSKAFK